MSARVKCAHCSHVFTAEQSTTRDLLESQGKPPTVTVTCPKCGKRTTIPNPDR